MNAEPHSTAHALGPPTFHLRTIPLQIIRMPSLWRSSAARLKSSYAPSGCANVPTLTVLLLQASSPATSSRMAAPRRFWASRALAAARPRSLLRRSRLPAAGPLWPSLAGLCLWEPRGGPLPLWRQPGAPGWHASCCCLGRLPTPPPWRTRRTHMPFPSPPSLPPTLH